MNCIAKLDYFCVYTSDFGVDNISFLETINKFIIIKGYIDEKFLDYINSEPPNFSKITGDYIIVVYDKVSNNLILVRDPIGTIDLFYLVVDDVFYFSTNIKFLLLLSPIRISIGFTSLFLCDYFHEKGETFFNNIKKITPNSINIVDFNLNISLSTILSIDTFFNQPIYRKSYNDYIEEFLFLLEKAIYRKLGNCSNIGFQMSGGLDSTSIFCYAITKQLLKDKKFNVYSFVFDKIKNCNEKPYINSIVDKFSLNESQKFKSLNLTNSYSLNNLDLNNIPFYPTPIIDLYEIMVLELLDSATINSNEIILTGHGGDELMVYRKFIETKIKNVMFLLERKRLILNNKIIHEDTKFELLKKMDNGTNDLSIADDNSYFTFQCYNNLSNKKLFFRHPFLDLDLIRYSHNLNSEIKATYMKTKKMFLRRSMKGILPEKVRLRTYRNSFEPILLAGLKQNIDKIIALLENQHLLNFVDNLYLNNLKTEFIKNPFSLKDSKVMDFWKIISIAIWIEGIKQNCDINLIFE